jgi:hypothetical protein
MSTGSILAMTAVERRKRNVRSRTVALSFVLILALALATGSVLIAYVAATASLLTLPTMLVIRAIRGDSTAPIKSFVHRWINAEVREAA